MTTNELNRDNVLSAIRRVYDAACQDEDNVRLGLAIDLRGTKGIDAPGGYDDWELEGSGSTKDKEFQALADEIIDHCSKNGPDSFVVLEAYWNDPVLNSAEPDDYGLEVRNGILSVHAND